MNGLQSSIGLLAESWKPKNLRDGYQIRIKGEEILYLMASEYGNGVVGSSNRKGKGRTFQPGP